MKCASCVKEKGTSVVIVMEVSVMTAMEQENADVINVVVVGIGCVRNVL